MKKLYFSHIKNEILLWFFIVSVLPLIFISVLYFLNLRSDFEQNTQKYLDQVLNQRAQATQNYIDTLENQLETTALLPATKKYLNKYKELFKNKKINRDADTDLFYKDLLAKYGYYDLFIIDMNGNIVYTVKKESDLHQNLRSKMLKDSGLTWAFDRSKLMSSTEISTFAYYKPSMAKASFITTPIFEQNKIAGILAFQISEKKLFDMIINYEGLGESGEIVAGYFDKYKNVVSALPLRHRPNAFTNNFILQHYSSTDVNLPVKDAILGNSGKGIVYDYRGVKSYAAWKYIECLRWGMVVKIDYDEIMQPVYKRALINILILFFVIFFIAAAIILITKHIVRPLQILTAKVKSLSNGDIKVISYKDLKINNEIGTLFKNFSEMSKSLYRSQKTIKTYATKLESKVELRTQELQKNKNELEAVNENMKKHLDIIDKYVITSSTDLDGIITDVSEAFCKISGYKKEELIGKKHDILRHPDTPESLYEELWDTITKGKNWQGEIKNRKKDGSYYWVDAIVAPIFDKEGNIEGYNSIRQDITDRKKAEKLSITDPLTKIYNRIHLEESFKEEINIAKRYRMNFSVILLDIDHFKEVNDTYGHDVGDEVLMDLVAILQKNIRATDILGRWGGEEFLIILPQTNLSEAGRLAEKLRIQIQKHEFHRVGSQTCSFGISGFKDDDESSKNIIKRADNALYDAKHFGRNCVKISKE